MAGNPYDLGPNYNPKLKTGLILMQLILWWVMNPIQQLSHISLTSNLIPISHQTTATIKHLTIPIRPKTYPITHLSIPNPNQPVNFNQPPNYPHQPLSPLGPEQKQQLIGTICPYCNMLTTSYTKKGVGTMTWLWCVGLWFFTGICCWIPFVIDDCKEDQIICARCHGKKAVL